MTDRYDTSNFPEDQSEPGSNGTVLKNLLGITRREELEHVEELRFERLMEAAAARFDSEHRFTAQDILWLHHFWLDGLFSWAGAYRTVNIGKGGFMFATAAHVPELMRQFENNQLARLSPCCFARVENAAAALAEVHVELVLIHPFCEGNGRIARLLAVLMALQPDCRRWIFQICRGQSGRRISLRYGRGWIEIISRWRGFSAGLSSGR